MNKKTLTYKFKNTFPFVVSMDSKKFDMLVQSATYNEYPTGTVILEGHTCRNLLLLLEGSIRVYKLSPDGKEITLYRISKGETCVLIVSCLLGDTKYPAIAEVEEYADKKSIMTSEVELPANTRTSTSLSFT